MVRAGTMCTVASVVVVVVVCSTNSFFFSAWNITRNISRLFKCSIVIELGGKNIF